MFNETTKIRVGVIGCGNIATGYHLPSYMKLKDVIVSSLCDSNKNKLLSASKKYGIKNVYTNVDELLEKETLDVVDICTPAFTHYNICKKAMEKGIKNILVEKPIALKFGEVLNLQRLSEKTNTKICVIHNYRFRKPMLKLLELYRDGKIGTIEEVISINHGLSAFSSYDWRYDENKSGGILYESGIHALDFQTWFCGDHKRIISTHHVYDKNLKFTTRIYSVVEYENNAIGILDLAAFSSSTIFSFHVFGTAMDAHVKFFPDYISTATGALSFYKEFFAENKRFFGFIKEILPWGMAKYKMDYHYPLISKFIDAIKNNGEPPITVVDILPTMKLLEDLKNSIELTTV